MGSWFTFFVNRLAVFFVASTISAIKLAFCLFNASGFLRTTRVRGIG